MALNLSGVTILGNVNITDNIHTQNVEANNLVEFISWVQKFGNVSIIYTWNSFSLRYEKNNWFVSGKIRPDIKLS